MIPRDVAWMVFIALAALFGMIVFIAYGLATFHPPRTDIYYCKLGDPRLPPMAPCKWFHWYRQVSNGSGKYANP